MIPPNPLESDILFHNGEILGSTTIDNNRKSRIMSKTMIGTTHRTESRKSRRNNSEIIPFDVPFPFLPTTMPVIEMLCHRYRQLLIM
ncbi:MAG: hypothetical protein LBI18_15495 [Planctomycetaceae bacterium]|nr:hypothetical protein [Planctomycetaceae bacterium]